MDSGSTWDDNSSYSQQNPSGCVRCLHQILHDPPKFRITELFSSYLGRYQWDAWFRAQPHLEPSSSCGWEFASELPSSSQPLGSLISRGGDKSGLRCWALGRAARSNPGHIAVPDRRWPVIPGSPSISRQLPPRAEASMLINTQMKGSCWVVINICHQYLSLRPAAADGLNPYIQMSVCLNCGQGRERWFHCERLVLSAALNHTGTHQQKQSRPLCPGTIIRL